VTLAADGEIIPVRDMVKMNIHVFRVDGGALREAGRIPLTGGGTAIRSEVR
jgi:hypothetical protein